MKSFQGTTKEKFSCFIHDELVRNIKSFVKTSGEVKNLFQFTTHLVLNELILNMISLSYEIQQLKLFLCFSILCQLLQPLNTFHVSFQSCLCHLRLIACFHLPSNFSNSILVMLWRISRQIVCLPTLQLIKLANRVGNPFLAFEN